MDILKRLRGLIPRQAVAPGPAPEDQSFTSAKSRKTAVAPDIGLGKLSLWIGGSSGEGWLDAALTVGDQYETALDAHGPLIQKSSIAAFERQLAELSEAEKGTAVLDSDGGSVTVTVRRFDFGLGDSCEVALQRSIYSHEVSFMFARQDYERALAGLRSLLARFERERRARRWMPAPERVFGEEAAIAEPARQIAGTLVTEDYPAEALRLGEQGTVGVAFTVTGDGEVAGVSVQDSSGSPRLDAAACLIAAERFRYEPARDADGRPVAQRLRHKVVWQLAPDENEDSLAAPEPELHPSTPRPPLQASDVSFRYTVDGVGWFSVSVQVGDKEHGFGGSAYMTDAMGDLLRVGLALAAGETRADIVCDAEPFLCRVEFERTLLNRDAPSEGWEPDHGCLIRIRPIDHFDHHPGEVEFEAICTSPLTVAEAIYRMALPHFQENEGWERAPFVALEATLAALRTMNGPN